MKSMIKKWLGIDELEIRVERLERDFNNIEKILSSMGQYNKKTSNDLNEMKGALKVLICSVHELIEFSENEHDKKKANSLLSRLKNNQTRIHNALLRKSA